MNIIFRFIVRAIVILAAAGPAFGLEIPAKAPVELGFDAEKLEAMVPVFDRYPQGGELAGIEIVVARHGHIAWQRSLGHRSFTKDTPLGTDTIYRIYSMSKPITATAMMILWEEGRFKLDDPVARYLPEFARTKVWAGETETGAAILEEQRTPFTIRHLLTHTAGLTYGFSDSHPVERAYKEANLFASPSIEAFSKTLATLPLLFQPGSRYQYSMAVDLQGRLIEVLSGMPFDRFLRQRLLDPLDMRDTGFWIPPEDQHRQARLYRLVPEAGPQEATELFEEVRRPIGILSGGGGLVSTARDYLRFCQMILGGGQLHGVRILDPATVRMMSTNQLPGILGEAVAAPGARAFGLGFGISEKPRTIYWGGAAGTVFWIDQSNDLTAILMTQMMSGNAPLRDELQQGVYGALQLPAAVVP